MFCAVDGSVGPVDLVRKIRPIGELGAKLAATVSCLD